MEPESWVKDFVGIPFKEHGRDSNGCDCWGLYRLIVRKIFDLDVPSYCSSYNDTENEVEISRLIHYEAKLWDSIPVGYEKPGDAILIRMRGEPMHIGIVAGGGYMLHITKGINASLEKYNGLRWKHRIIGFYRHSMRYQNE